MVLYTRALMAFQTIKCLNDFKRKNLSCWTNMRMRMMMQVKTRKTTNLTFGLIRRYHYLK